jgi:hypothetical protein
MKLNPWKKVKGKDEWEHTGGSVIYVARGNPLVDGYNGYSVLARDKSRIGRIQSLYPSVSAVKEDIKKYGKIKMRKLTKKDAINTAKEYMGLTP